VGKTNLAYNTQQLWQRRLFSFTPYVIVCIILIVLPDFLSSYFLSMLTKILIFATFAISLDLILGYTGLMSLGHATFLGVAGYTMGILMLKYGMSNFWVLIPLSVLASGIVATIVGYISLRVSGVYFMLVTFAFGQLFSVIASQWRPVTGGSDGLVGISYPNLGIPGFELTAFSFYYLVFIAFIICFFLLHLIINSTFGRALVGIRENEQRMQCLGYNTWAHKYVAFIIGGVFAGVAGALFAPFYGAMVPEHLSLVTSASVMLMVIIGGAGTLFGPVLGSVLVILLEQISSIYAIERWPLILGSVFVICVLFIRGGFAVYISRFWKKVRLKHGSIAT
jgi:branched-chain amino acid transport system permease protein